MVKNNNISKSLFCLYEGIMLQPLHYHYLVIFHKLRKTKKIAYILVEIIFNFYDEIYFVYQKALIQTFHTCFWLQITFVNSQRDNTNLKGNFVFKNRFESFIKKNSGIQEKIWLKNIYCFDFNAKFKSNKELV